eukprot:CAMPEP_0119418506 /NCGR_PEP_ID=MMETSP1335-20130426/18409_1 /TAXON_ID=259385 /ORGANISM="Chrysoculter rhomboideus, Strain RCC1486" /LENGTH=136 /DNA_ID=CAMNT_0007443757 /DNA_START=21 /DNA_END=431 /DNA_ORIENTATION=+
MASWGEQERHGDQSESARKALWRSGFKTCPKCSEQRISRKEIGAGCRQNGDGYGTEVFTCGACGFVTSFYYDEASVPSLYETSGWDRQPKKEPSHDYSGLPKVSIDPDGSQYRKHVAEDKPGTWVKGPDGKWVKKA